MFKKLLILLVICALLFLGISVFAQEFTLKCGSIEAVGGIEYQTMQWVIGEINQRSEGRIKIDYYPASQLGSTNEQIDAVITGSLDLLAMAGNIMGNIHKDYTIDSLPFVFRDQQHRIAYQNSELNKERQEILLKEIGLRIIVDNWFTKQHVLVSTRPILKPEDFEGFKMRVPEVKGQFIGWSQEIGHSAITIPFGEVYLALRQGLVDGVATRFETIAENHFPEVAPHITMIGAEFGYECVMMNEKSYQKLPADLIDILVIVFNEGGKKYAELMDMEAEKALKYLEEVGAKVYEVDTALFRERMKNLPEELDKAGLLSKEMFEKINNL